MINTDTKRCPCFFYVCVGYPTLRAFGTLCYVCGVANPHTSVWGYREHVSPTRFIGYYFINYNLIQTPF